MGTSGWRREWGGDMPIQVYPEGDLREHITDGHACWCGAEEEDGVIVHNSADGREKFETGERKGVMSEMVERVAKAICEWNGKTTWTEAIEGQPYSLSADHYRIIARAAIAAMREPTRAQLSHASMAIGPWGGHGEPSAPSEAQVWRAMIDAALAPDQAPNSTAETDAQSAVKSD